MNLLTWKFIRCLLINKFRNCFLCLSSLKTQRVATQLGYRMFTSTQLRYALTQGKARWNKSLLWRQFSHFCPQIRFLDYSHCNEDRKGSSPRNERMPSSWNHVSYLCPRKPDGGIVNPPPSVLQQWDYTSGSGKPCPSIPVPGVSERPRTTRWWRSPNNNSRNSPKKLSGRLRIPSWWGYRSSAQLEILSTPGLKRLLPANNVPISRISI